MYFTVYKDDLYSVVLWMNEFNLCTTPRRHNPCGWKYAAFIFGTTRERDMKIRPNLQGNDYV